MRNYWIGGYHSQFNLQLVRAFLLYWVFIVLTRKEVRARVHARPLVEDGEMGCLKQPRLASRENLWLLMAVRGYCKGRADAGVKGREGLQPRRPCEVEVAGGAGMTQMGGKAKPAQRRGHAGSCKARGRRHPCEVTVRVEQA